MTLAEIREIPARIKMLVTRKFEWTDVESGTTTITKESWHATWAIAGIHSYQWWWVCKFGQMDCGCTKNPITRRLVLISGKCEKHGLIRFRR